MVEPTPLTEKLLLIMLSAVVSFLVAAWYGGRLVGEVIAHNDEQDRQIARLEATDITAGAREQFAVLKSHMAADDLQFQAFDTQMAIIRERQDDVRTRLNALEQALHERQRQSQR